MKFHPNMMNTIFSKTHKIIILFWHVIEVEDYMPMQIYGFNNNYLLLTIMSMICSNVVVSYEWLISFTWDQRCHHLYKKFVILPYFLYCFFNSNTRVLMIVYSIFLELFVFCSVCMKQCCLFNAYFYEQ